MTKISRAGPDSVNNTYTQIHTNAFAEKKIGLGVSLKVVTLKHEYAVKEQVVDTIYSNSKHIEMIQFPYVLRRF